MNNDKIDQRIVEMSFENQKFEEGISKSQNSLKKFSDALRNSDIDQGFSGLDKSVSTLASSFSMLEQIGVGALRRIGEAAINAGSQMIKSLTIDPAIAGWTKYEQKTAAVQTIMNATGKSIGDVNGYLEELMWFSDETSYGFTDMTAALAQMTSSGGDVEKLIPLITGVANATAFAGKGAAEFSRAMFNLNQSYGAGNLQYQDWRSLELAGVAGQDLKQILIDTGKAMGVLNKKGETAKGTLVDIGTFGSTLNEKWANTKVMETAFGKFSELSAAAYKLVKEGKFDTAAEAMESLAGKYSMIAEKGFAAAQTAKSFSEAISATIDAVSSGWMRTYELMFGDLEEAKKNFTALTGILWEVFASGAESRNEMLAWVKEFGGVSNVFQGLKNIAIAFLKILLPISQAFDEIFPPKTREQWLEITKQFKKFTASLSIADSTGDKIRRTFAGLFAVIDIGLQLVKFLGKSVFELVKVFLPLNDGILDSSASLGDFLVSLNKAMKSTEFFQYGILAIKVGTTLLREQLSKTITVVKDFVLGLWNAEDPFEYIRSVGTNLFSGFISGIKMVTSWISEKFTKAVKGIFKFFDQDFDETVVGIWPTILAVLKEVVTFISGEASEGFKTFGDAIKSLDFSRIATFVVGGVILLFISQLTDLTKAMTDFVASLSGAVKAYAKKFFSMPQTGLIKDMSLAIGTLAASIWVLSTIPADDLERSFIGLAKAIGVFVVAYALIQTINVSAAKLTSSKEMATSAFGLTGIAAALLIMAVAVKIISKINKDDVWNSTLVVGAMLGFIAAYEVFSALISKIPGQQKVVMNLLAMSLAVNSLVGTLHLLKFLTRTEIEASLGKLASVMLVIGALELVFAITAKVGRGKKLAVTLIQLAVGITAMIGVIKLLNFLDRSTIVQSIGNLALITLIIAGIELVMGLVSRISGGKKVQTNILAMGVGILAMVGLVAIIGNMKPIVLDQGILNLTKMAGVVVGIQLLTALAARIAGGNKVQRILGTVSFTLLSFTGVIAILGKMEDETINRGIGTLKKMIGLIGAIEIMTALTSRIGGSLRMFSSLLGVTTAIATLTGAIALLSMTDQTTLRKAVDSLVIASVAIGILSFAVQNITSSVNSMSKGTKSFKTKATNFAFALVGLGVVLGATAGFFAVMKPNLELIKTVSVKDMAIFTIGFAAVSVLFTVVSSMGRQVKGANLGKQQNDFTSGFAALLGVLLTTVAFFAGLKLVLPIIKDIDWNDFALFLVGMTAITGLLFGINILGKAMGDVQIGKQRTDLTSGFGALLGILLGTVAFFAAFKLVLPIIQGINADDFAKFILVVGGVTLIMAGIAALGTAFTLLGKGGMAAIEGIGIALIGVIAIVGTVVLLAEALNVMIKDESKLIRGINLLVEIGAGLGRFIGGVVGGIAGGALETIGVSVAKFANSMNTVTFSPGALEAIVSLATAVLIISGVSLVEGFKRLIGLGTNSMETFGVQLVGLINSFKVISIDDADMASNVLIAMKPMADNLLAFTTAAKDIPNSGGWFGKLVGDNDIDTFGVKLARMVAAFLMVTEEQIKLASTNLTAMIPMAQNLDVFSKTASGIPNSGGWLGKLVGDNDIDTFGKKLVKLIAAFLMVTELQVIQAGINLAAMTPMSSNLSAFAKMSKDIPNSGGWLGKLVGDNDIDTFGVKLASLIGLFGSIVPSNITSASDNLQTMNTGMLPNLRIFVSFADSVTSYQGFDLVNFANDLRSFVTVLSNTDFTVVAPAMEAMGTITDSFQTLGGVVLDNAKKSFENNKVPFQTMIASILGESIKKLDEQRKELIGKFTGIFSSVISSSTLYTGKFKTLGVNIINGLIEGIESRRPTAVNITKGVLSAVVYGAQRTVEARSPSKVFEKIGGWCTLGLAQGIKKEANVAVLAGKNMALATEEAVRDTLGVHSLSTLYVSIGKWIGKSLGIGQKESVPGAVAESKNLGDTITTTLTNTLEEGKALVQKKAAELGFDASKITTEGIKNVITGGNSGITNTVTSVLAMLEKNKEDAAAATGKAGDAVNKSATQGVRNLGGAVKNVKTKIEKLKEELDSLNFYGNVTLEEELLKYTNLRKKYKEGSPEDKQLDQEVYTRLKTIYNGQLAYIDGIKKAKEDAAKETAELEIKYNKDVASELESAEADRIRTRKEFADKQTAINEKLISDITAQNNAYENAVKSRASTIASSYGLFDSVDLGAKASGFELLKNLNDQNDALTVWKHSLSELEKRGVGDALIEELQNMGPAANAQLRALLSLTDTQLTEYDDLFKRKYSFATNVAEDELSGLKNSTLQAIGTLTSDAKTELGALSAQFDKTMVEINTDSQTSLGELATSYNESLAIINTNLGTDLETMKTNFDTTMKTIRGQTEKEFIAMIAKNKEQIGQMNKDSATKLGELKSTFGAGATSAVSAFGKPIKELVPNTTAAIDALKPSLKETFETMTSDFVTAGLNAAAGFAKGIREGTYLAIDAATYLASNAVTTAQRILNENSPSKVFEGIGQFVSTGFANGIKDYAYQAEKASEELARGPIAAVSQALASIEDKDDYSFTITPVIDLSAIRSTDLSRLIGMPVNLGNTSAQLATETVQNGINLRQPTTTNGETNNATTNNASIQMTNNFSVRSDDDIRKISNRLGNLLDRYSNAKGVPVV